MFLMLLKCEGRNVYQVLWNKVYDDDSAEYANMSEEELYKVLGTSLYKESPYSQGSLGEGMTLVRQAIDGYCKPRYLMDDDKEINLYGAIDRKGKVVRRFTLKR